jgi:cell pole-organizing protein PopZ
MAKEQEQSMEDILRSIKRIITEEGEGDAAPAAPDMSVAPAAGQESPPMAAEAAAVSRPPSAGSDILELTDILPAEEAAPAADTTLSVDAVMSMPTASAPTPAPARAAKKSKPLSPPPGAREVEGIVSDDTLVSAASSLRSLNQISDNAAARHEPIPSMPLRSGITVEDLVIEALRPMLRSWLDANLPQVVERLVDREVRRISATSQ